MKRVFSLIIIIALLLSVSASADVIERDPVGMWAFFWDLRSYYESMKGGENLPFDSQGCSLFLCEDGAAFLTSIKVKDGISDFSNIAICGVWLGTDKEMKIRIPGYTYDAYIDDDDRLLLKVSEYDYCVFTRIPSSNYVEGML